VKKLNVCAFLAVGLITSISFCSESLVSMSALKQKLALIKASDVVAFLMGAYARTPETLPEAAVATVVTGMLGGLANSFQGLAQYGITDQSQQETSEIRPMSYLQYFGRTAAAYAIGTITGHIWELPSMTALRKAITQDIIRSLAFLSDILPSGKIVTVAAMLAGGILLYRSGQQQIH
jgi:hypothetical protein